jgi:hypothetical protein
MDESDSAAKTLTFEQLADRREKTEAIARFLQAQLQTHLETLRPLLTPRRVLGKYVGVKEDVPGADKAFAQLRTQFQEVCAKPFGLLPELEQDHLVLTENRIELYPWEYMYEAKSAKETKTVTMTSPVRWVLTYTSGYTLSQLRQAMEGKVERRQGDVRQFVVNVLMMGLLLDKFPGLSQLLTDLRYEVRREKCPGLGDLPLVTVSSCLSSFRPADDLILMATRFSGVPAFIELVDTDAVPTLQDPLKLRIEQMLR